MVQKQKLEDLGVKDGDEIVIKGTVSFARLDKLVEGDALAEENKRRAQRGMITANAPFRSITIENPEVTDGQGTPLATYYGQRVYTAKSGNPSLSLESKSHYPPTYGHMQNGTLVEIPDPKRNPDKGQTVFLIIKAYQSKKFSNMGSSFDAIVFPEGPINFYEGANSLVNFGEKMGIPVQTLDTSEQDPVETAATPTETPTEQPEQTNTNAFGNTNTNAFGVQDDQVGNSGQKTNTPFG